MYPDIEKKKRERERKCETFPKIGSLLLVAPSKARRVAKKKAQEKKEQNEKKKEKEEEEEKEKEKTDELRGGRRYTKNR